MLEQIVTGHGLQGVVAGKFAFVCVMYYTRAGCVYLYMIAFCLANFMKTETIVCVMY